MALIDDTKQHMSTAIANLDLIEQAHNDEVVALQQQIADLENPKRKTLWGSSIETRGPQAWPDALARVEKAIGPVDITRFFHSPGQGPNLPAQLGQGSPRSMVYSFKFEPAKVIAGAADAQFTSMLPQVDKYLNSNPKARFYWTLEHEGDIRIRNGAYSAADYVKAWDHLLKIAGDTHARFLSCNIFTRWCLEPQVKFDAQAAIHPGVDVLGWDPYKQAPNVTVPSMFDPIVAFCKQVGKPWGIAEVGINSRNPNDGKTFHTPAQKAQAATDIATYLKASDAEFVSYFNSDPGAVPPAGWGWPLDYPSEVAAAKAWATVRAS